MTDRIGSESEDKVGWLILGWAVAILVVFFLVFGFYKLLIHSQDVKDFHAVCTYLGGEKKDDVCIKDNTIVLTFDQWKERVK